MYMYLCMLYNAYDFNSFRPTDLIDQLYPPYTRFHDVYLEQPHKRNSMCSFRYRRFRKLSTKYLNNMLSVISGLWALFKFPVCVAAYRFGSGQTASRTSRYVSFALHKQYVYLLFLRYLTANTYIRDNVLAYLITYTIGLTLQLYNFTTQTANRGEGRQIMTGSQGLWFSVCHTVLRTNG